MKTRLNTLSPEVKKLLEEHETEYLNKIPTVIPEGKMLVHNNVRPARRLGTRGFRAWLQSPSSLRESCSCGWAPEHPQHFRVIRTNAA